MCILWRSVLVQYQGVVVLGEFELFQGVYVEQYFIVVYVWCNQCCDFGQVDIVELQLVQLCVLVCGVVVGCVQGDWCVVFQCEFCCQGFWYCYLGCFGIEQEGYVLVVDLFVQQVMVLVVVGQV